MRPAGRSSTPAPTRGTVQSDRLQGWTLSYRTHGEAQETVFATGSTRGVQPKHAERLRLILGRLHAAASPRDMGLPGLRLAFTDCLGPCSEANVGTRACVASACAPVCNAGFDDCSVDDGTVVLGTTALTGSLFVAGRTVQIGAGSNVGGLAANVVDPGAGFSYTDADALSVNISASGGNLPRTISGVSANNGAIALATQAGDLTVAARPVNAGTSAVSLTAGGNGSSLTLSGTTAVTGTSESGAKEVSNLIVPNGTPGYEPGQPYRFRIWYSFPRGSVREPTPIAVMVSESVCRSM